VDPVHAFKLIGMLLDAHINLKTIDIVPLLFSPKMVRLSLPAAASRGKHASEPPLQTHGVVHAFHAAATGQCQGGGGGTGHKPR
jgi:hypothetical protein